MKVEFSKKRTLIAIISYILFMVFVVNVCHFPIRGEKGLSTKLTEPAGTTVEYISDQRVVVQSLFFHKPIVLHSMDVLAANYNNTVTMPLLQYYIKDNRNRVIYSSSIPTSEIVDNQNLHLDLGDTALKANQRYFLYFQGPIANENDVCPTFYTMKSDSVSDYLYLDSEEFQDGKAICATYHYDVTGLGAGMAIFYGIVLILFLAIANVRLVRHMFKLRYIPYWIFCSCLGIVFISLFTSPDPINETLFSNKDALINMIIILTVVVIAILIYQVLSRIFDLKRVGHFLQRYRGLIGILFFSGLFALQYLLASNIYQKIGWDVGIVWDNVTDWMTNEDAQLSGYIQLYPNNIGLGLVMYLLRSFVKNSDMAVQYKMVVIFNILLVDFGIYITYKLAHKLWGFYWASFATLLLTALFGFSGYLIVPYTDTLTFFIPVLILYLYFCLKDKKHSPLFRFSNLGIIGFLAYWGYHLKPQCLIIFVAIVFVELIHATINVYSRKEWNVVNVVQKTWKKALFLAVGLLVGVLTFQTASKLIVPQQDEKLGATPMTHFIMMGLNENPSAIGIGSFSYEDARFTQNIPEKRDKIEQNKAKIQARMSDFGFAGWITHLYKKAVWILGDGSFFWQIEGGFYQEDYSKKQNSEKQENIRQMYYGRYGGYDDEKLFAFLEKLSGIWFLILLFILIPVRGSDTKTRMIEIAVLAALGCILFTIFFEGRSRYLINYLPLFVIGAMAGIKCLAARIGKAADRCVSNKLCKKDGKKNDC